MAFLEIAGILATSAALQVPRVGCWLVDLDSDDLTAHAGAVVVKIEELELRGTVDPEFSGVYLAKSRTRVVGGIGWRKTVAAAQWHSDAGVKASVIANQTARDAGEELDGAPVDHVGIDFVRKEAPARRVLERLFGSWWVDYAGVTHVGDRPEVEASDAYQILDFDPRAKVATLAVDKPQAIGVGTILRAGLASPLVVRGMDMSVGGALRVSAWCRELA